MVEIAGVSLSGIGQSFSSIGSSVGIVLIVFLVVLVGGGLTFYFYTKKNKNRNYNHTVNLFKIVNGKRYWIKSDTAMEITIPATGVRLLHWRNLNLYSSYPTRAMGNNVYAYMINRVGELTNFDLDAGEDPTEAKVDYDHRDQAYAYLYLQNFIERNYRSKEKISWWKENLPLITIIVCAVLLGLEMWFFFSQSSKQLAQWTNIANSFKEAAQQMANAVLQTKNLGAGVVAT